MKDSIPNCKGLSIESLLNTLSKKNQSLIKDFLKYCSITASDTSITKIQGKIVLIADTLNKPLDNLNLKDIQNFLILLNKSNFAISTKNDFKKILKRFIKWNYKDYSSRFGDLKEIRLNTKNEGRQLDKSDLLTPDEMKVLVNSIDSLKYKTILLLMQETANRPEELLKIKWKDIDFNSNEIKLNSSKTRETRNIPINKSVEHLRRYKTECFYDTPRNEDYVFPGIRDKTKPMTTQALSDFLLKLERKLNFSKHLYPYLWRHSILSNMITKLSPKVYEMYSGHSLETGMKTYSHLDTEDLKKELFDKVYKIEKLTQQDNKRLEELKEIIISLMKLYSLQSKIIKKTSKDKELIKKLTVLEKQLKIKE